MGRWVEIGVGSGGIISVLVAAVGIYGRTPCEFCSISVYICKLLYARLSVVSPVSSVPSILTEYEPGGVIVGLNVATMGPYA